MHVYVLEHIIKSAFTTKPLNGCLRNFVGMKCSRPGTCIKIFWPYLLGADPGRGKIGHRFRGWGGGATNQIHRSICYEVLFLVPFHSQFFAP